jgi:hypothetical protein
MRRQEDYRENKVCILWERGKTGGKMEDVRGRVTSLWQENISEYDG